MRVGFRHGGKVKFFHHKRDVRDAKSAFQWVYGYWPDDFQIVSKDDDGDVVEPDANAKDQMESMKGMFK